MYDRLHGSKRCMVLLSLRRPRFCSCSFKYQRVNCIFLTVSTLHQVRANSMTSHWLKSGQLLQFYRLTPCCAFSFAGILITADRKRSTWNSPTSGLTLLWSHSLSRECCLCGYRFREWVRKRLLQIMRPRRGRCVIAASICRSFNQRSMDPASIPTSETKSQTDKT